MRRTGRLVAGILVLACSPALAQQGTINPRIPPPPPPEAVSAPETAPPVAPAPAAQPIPETVEIASGTRIPVTLDTPLSTRISKKGQVVSFRTADPVRVHDLLEIPPDTEIVGTVVEARRPGGFGRPGTLRVKITGIRLSNGAETNIAARLDSRDMKQGRISADKNGSANAVDIAQWAVLGTLTGWQVDGGKGAGYGAAAGATVGLIILMARRGPDLYVEPGTPFAVVVDQPVTLQGAEVQAAQESYVRAHGPMSGPRQGSLSTQDPNDDDSRVPDSRRPKLKRRPPPNP